MATPKLTLFIDIRSGFTYLLFTVIRRSSVFANCDVTYVPTDLRALWKSCNNPGGWDVKNKPAWVGRSAMLWAKKFHVPFSGPPEKFLESSTTQLQQALCAVSVRYPDKLPDLIEVLEEAFWVGKQQLFHRDVFQPEFEKVLGVERGREAVEAGQTQHIQDLLTANTERCISEGGFGLPWYVCTNAAGETESFFGFDHLELATEFLWLDRATPESMTERGGRPTK